MRDISGSGGLAIKVIGDEGMLGDAGEGYDVARNSY